MTLRQELFDQLQRGEGRINCVSSVLKDLALNEGLDLESYILKFEDLASQLRIQKAALAKLFPLEAKNNLTGGRLPFVPPVA